MRFLIVLAASLALVLGCSDGDGTGSGGDAGAGGDGGSEADVARTFVLYSPIPPCARGVESDYYVDFLGDTDVIQEIRGSSAQCTGFEGVERFNMITRALSAGAANEEPGARGLASA